MRVCRGEIGWSLLRGCAKQLGGVTVSPWSSNLTPRRKSGGSHLVITSQRILKSLDHGGAKDVQLGRENRQRE